MREGPALVVAQPEDGIPAEDGAGGESASQLVDPGVVKGHPGRAGVGREARGLDRVPEGAVVEVAMRLERVDGPAAALGEHEGPQRRDEHRPGGLATEISPAPPPHDERAETQHDGRERV